MKVHPLIHFLWKNAMRLVLVLVFVGIPAAVSYTHLTLPTIYSV